MCPRATPDPPCKPPRTSAPQCHHHEGLAVSLSALCEAKAPWLTATHSTQMARQPHATSVLAVSTKPFSGWDSPQPLADQAPKFLQVFGKPPLSLWQMFAPFTTGEPGPAASRELQCGRDPNVSLPGDLSHCCPSSALSPGRDGAHRSSGPGGDFSAPPVARAGQSSGTFFQPTCICQMSHIHRGAMASTRAQEDCLCATSLGLSCPRNRTSIPCPLPELGHHHRTAAILPRLPQAPLLSMATPSQATASTSGQPTGDTHLRTHEFLNESSVPESFHKVQQPFKTSQRVLNIKS